MNIEEIRELTGNERLDPDFPDTVKLALYERYFELQEQLDRVKAYILKIKPEESVAHSYDYNLTPVSTDEVQAAHAGKPSVTKIKDPKELDALDKCISYLRSRIPQEFDNSETISWAIDVARLYKSTQPGKTSAVLRALELRRDMWMKYFVEPNLQRRPLVQLEVAIRYYQKLTREIRHLRENPRTATVVLESLSAIALGPDLLPSIEWIQTRDEAWWSL